MKTSSGCGNHVIRPLSGSSSTMFGFFLRSCHPSLSSFIGSLTSRVRPFWIQLHYFVILSLLGYLGLKISKPRTTASLAPKDLDLFFTAVSATTVASMSTVEMEVFSNTQLGLLSILMLAGGEVFTSMLGLQLKRFLFKKRMETLTGLASVGSDSTNSAASVGDQIELGVVKIEEMDDVKTDTNPELGGSGGMRSDHLRYRSVACLGYVVFFYHLVVHIAGSAMVSVYVSLVPSAKQVLESKGLRIQTFSIFTTISTFSNCGFVPTNENMIVFRSNSGLLWLLIPQVLLGNTLYPACLRLLIWTLERTTKREELRYILSNYGDLGYGHLLSGLRCCCLVFTVFGFVLVQFVMFCSMEWNSEAMDGLNSYQKFVASIFQVVNSRHTGESVFDLSSISQAILVLFVIMM